MLTKCLIKNISTLWLCVCIAANAMPSDKKTSRNLGESQHVLPGVPSATLSNINRISAWYSDTGELESYPPNNGPGLTFPRGTATAVFNAGVLWGGKFYDDQTPSLRVNGQMYNYLGTQAGAILGLRTGVAEDPSAPDVRIWRIRVDYSTADLTQDAAEFFRTQSPTPEQIDSVRTQYAIDWAEWPWQKGAPFYDTGYLDATGTRVGTDNDTLDWGEDTNRNGVFDPDEDTNSNGMLDAEKPGIAEADQVLWYVCNDIGVSQPWSCPATGIEEQTSVWAYDTTGALGDAIFRRFRLIYKGISTTPASATIDSMYISQWSDPDVGTFSDDFAGSDSLLELGYAYNADSLDTMYSDYGLSPPAIGYAIIQGPVVSSGNFSDTAIFDFRKIAGAINRRANAFVNIDAYSHPTFDYSGAISWHQAMRGLPTVPRGPPDPLPLIDPTTGLPAGPFWLYGDPVAGTGWIDGLIEGPGDRRLLLSTGPFAMAIGDTQEVIVSVIGGLGNGHLNSVSVLKSSTREIRQWYNDLVGIVSSVRDVAGVLPEGLKLEQNYPNPFNPHTTIRFSIPEGLRTSQVISLHVFDILGRIVTTLVEGKISPGRYEVDLDASRLASGVYLYRLQSGEATVFKRMMLVK